MLSKRMFENNIHWIMEFPTSFSASNEDCQLNLHKYSLRGVFADYIIHFQNTETDLDLVVNKTFELFQLLCEHYSDKFTKSRLIAECEFERLDGLKVIATETYHFASYSSERLNKYNCSEFYQRHMKKIAARLTDFNNYGSSLRLLCIKHIHISVSVCPPLYSN